MFWNRKRVVAALIGAVAAATLTVLTLNFRMPETRIEQKIVHRYGIGDPQMRRELGILLGPPLIDGNRVVNLENGAEIFPAMLEAIRGAQRTITFETYIYWSGKVGREFADALSERARAGVRVHVLIDWVGSQKMDEGLLDEMRRSGVEIERYHPLRWYTLGRMNNRTHRKLLVVDGRIGFTGGVGIADQWDGNAEDPDHWRDSHFRLEGPAVAQMQAAFLDNWIKVSGEVLQGEGYFPPLPAAGDAQAQVFVSSPSGGSESMHLMYMLAIAAAEHSVDLSASYFVPDELTMRVLLDAIERGVHVRLIVPGEHLDVEIIRAASRARWGELLQAGAEIYTYDPTMFHVKMLVVDRLLVSVGSTNFDNRSFQLNDEANLNVYDAAFAKRVTEVFERDVVASRRVTFEEWQRRPWHERWGERISSWFSAQL